MIPDDVKKEIIQKYGLEGKGKSQKQREPSQNKNKWPYPSVIEFEINPYVGAGVIQLGMTSDQIQKALDFYPRKFRRHKEEVESEDFGVCFVYYKRPNICEAIEFTHPASVIFQGKNLIEQPYTEIKDFVRLFDNDLDCDLDGFTSYEYGFGVYASVAFREPMQPIEAVIVFERGYYDKK